MKIYFGRTASNHRYGLALALALLFVLSLSSLTFAQDDEPVIPEPDLPVTTDAAAGGIIYQERCAGCHGETGLGDGPMAPQAINPPTPIGSPEYLSTANPDVMFAIIQNGNMQAGMPGFGVGNNSNPLDDQDIWNTIAAIYELPLANEPIAAAVVSGQVTNATTGELLTEGTVSLQGFTPQAEETIFLEGELDGNGQFQFDLSLVPPQWLYRVVVNYNELDFASDFGRLSQSETAIELPVSIYESTTDPAAIGIAQLNVIVEFVEDRIRVNELYTLRNDSQQVFIGAEGDPNMGTFALTVPENAENVSFLRSVGGGPTDFVPATDQMVPRDDNGTEWGFPSPIAALTAPLRIIARYELPYDGQIDIAHPVLFAADETTLLITNPDVAVDAAAGWEERPANSSTIDPDAVTMYSGPALAAGRALEFALSGQPALVTDRQGNMIEVRDEQLELVIGGIALLLAAAVGGVQVWRWRNSSPPANERDLLLQELAALDEAYYNDKLRKSSYERQRNQIKDQLLSIWQDS